jgi:histidyl-tRNA synthetase
MSQTLQAIRGMNDILPVDAELWEQFEEAVRDWLRAYGYRPIRMPMVEPTPLFARAIGAVTDIVEKEMYSFEDALNGESLTLRPEGTASCVRAVLQHNLLYDGPKRLWYMGPMFRHERPQKGRYRQFHQVGVEALGFPGPDIDAEQIAMCARLWDDLGLDGIRLEINSLGQSDERARHRADLQAYLGKHQDQLDEDARRRLHSNPLRILDTKNPALQGVVEAAPKLIDYLGEESLKHFEGVQQLLKDAVIPYRINPRLVRGLDYYNLTVFEWVTDQLGRAGYGVRRRSLRRPGRATGRQACPCLRGSPWASSACWRFGRIRATSTKFRRPMPTWCIRARRRGALPSASPRLCAAEDLRSTCIAAAAASSRK